MAAGPDQERHQHRLHNFPLPSLRWGNQKLLRSINVHPSMYSLESDDLRHKAEARPAARSPSRPSKIRQKPVPLALPPPSPVDKFRKLPPLAIKSDDRIEQVRAKLLIHLQALTDVDEGERQREGGESPEQMPWSMRTRKGCKDAPIKDSIDEEKLRPDKSPPPQAGTRPKSKRLRSLAPERIEENKIEIPKISLSLSPDEIEEDFLAMTGSRPPRRPKKRPRNIQKKLDEVFPGLWLSNITLDCYEVSDLPEPKKT